jgi:hypothetical protein
MGTFEIIVILIFVVGIGFILYLILRDPILIIKSLLRGLKADGDWRLKILFSPIWSPIWLIDKVFKFKLYVKNVEEASRPKDIKFIDYDKYIQIDNHDTDYIEKILISFHNDYDPKNYNYTLNGAEVKLTNYDEFTFLKIEKNFVQKIQVSICFWFHK